MATRKLSPTLQAQILAKAKEGLTNRAIAAWLLSERGVKVTHQAVGKMLRAAKGAARAPETSRTPARNSTAPKAGDDEPEFDLGAAFGLGGMTGKDRRAAANAQRHAQMLREMADDTPPPIPGPESVVAERVDHCWRVMALGLWNGYASRQELAVAWGVTDSAIRTYAAEASRRLQLEPDEMAAAKVIHAKNCERVRRDALAMTSIVTGLPDFGSALKASELTAKFQGIELDEKKKVEITGKDGGPIETRTPTIMIPGEVQE